MEYIIETENLVKQYGAATIVDDINIHVPNGSVYGFLGRNAAGKSTAMKMMLNLVFPTEVEIYLFGLSLIILCLGYRPLFDFSLL